MHLSKSAFTVLELLVTISILLVLAVLIFGPAKSFISRSHEAKSLSNQRQIYMGLIGFHGDAGRFPSLTTGSSGNSFGGEPFWNQQILPYLGYKQSDYVGQNPAVPEVFYDPSITSNRRRGDFGVLYHNVHGPIKGWGNLSLSLQQLVRPSRTPLLVTAQQPVGSGLIGSWFANNTLADNTSQDISYRHRGGAVITFADGHSVWMERDNFRNEYLPFRNQ
jgi:prepilin-type processing-associated H-X9-DG protein